MKIHPFQPSLIHQRIRSRLSYPTIKAHFSLWESSVHCPTVRNGTAWDDTGLGWGGLLWHGSCPRQPLSLPLPPLPGVPVSSDRVRHRKGPNICPWGTDRDGIEGLTEIMIGEGEGGRFGTRCQLSGVTLPSEASRSNITGSWQRLKVLSKLNQEQKVSSYSAKGKRSHPTLSMKENTCSKKLVTLSVKLFLLDADWNQQKQYSKSQSLCSL